MARGGWDPFVSVWRLGKGGPFGGVETDRRLVQGLALPSDEASEIEVQGLGESALGFKSIGGGQQAAEPGAHQFVEICLVRQRVVQSSGEVVNEADVALYEIIAAERHPEAPRRDNPRLGSSGFVPTTETI